MNERPLHQPRRASAGIGAGVCHVALGRRYPDLLYILPDAFAFDLETWIVMHED